MRSWWPAVAMSLAVHAGLVTLLVTGGTAPRIDANPRREARGRAAPAPPPGALDVELIDGRDVRTDVPVRPIPEAPGPPRAAAAGSSPAVAAAAPRAAAHGTASPEPRAPQPPPAAEPASPTGRSRWLTMRHGDPPRLALPAGRWDALDHPPAGTAPARAPHSGLLDDAAGGARRSDQGTFVAGVGRDGTVQLEDQRNLQVHLGLPSPRALGSALAGWYESDKWRGDGGDTAMSRYVQVTGGATTEPKDPTTPRPQDRKTTVIAPVLSGGFDVTDWLMRSHGADPYAARKLAVLDATRDERAALGERERARQLARVPETVQHHLQAVWATATDLATRKQALFELWDDCAETGEPAVVAAGEAARRMVIGFIRAHLPAGGPEAYSAAEIAALARIQHSKAAFRPYD